MPQPPTVRPHLTLPERPAVGARRGVACGLVLWALLSAGLSGCAPHMRAQGDASVALPADYAQAPQEGGGAGSASQAGVVAPAAADWRHHFSDPVLLGLLERAVRHNRDVRVAALRVEEARAALGIQRADRLPTVAASVAATRSAVPADLNVSGRRVVGSQYQVGLGFASWEIDFWGRLASLDEAARQTYLSSEAAQRAVQLSVVTQVANGHLAWRDLDERLALAQRTLASRAESLRIFQRREALGATSRLELTQVELLWQQAKTLVAQLQQARAQQAHALSLLVGEPVVLQTSASSLDDLVLAAEPAVGLPSQLLVRRPDIVAAEHALQAARAQVDAARAAFFPRIALTASAGTASGALEGLFQSGSQAWTLAPQLSLPIFDRGRRQAALDLSEVRREQSVAGYEQAIQAAFRDVADALSARRWLAEQVAAVRTTLALQEERARLAKLRYDSGAVRYLEVLDAERDRLSVAQQLVQLRRAQLSADVALYAALGGGAEGDGSGDATAP